MTRIVETIKAIDWTLLRTQKEALITTMYQDVDNKNCLQGILNLIDAIQDAAVQDEIATEFEVFGD